MEKKLCDKLRIVYENNCFGFFVFWGCCSLLKWMSVNFNNVFCLLRIIVFRFVDLKIVEEFVEDWVNEIKIKRGDFFLVVESICKWNIDYFVCEIFIYMLWG